MIKLKKKKAIFKWLTGILIFILSTLSFQGITYAHSLSAAFTSIMINEQETTINYSIDTLSIIEGLGGDQNKDDTLDEDEVKDISHLLEEWVEHGILLEADGEPQSPELQNIVIERKNDTDVATLTFTLPGLQEGQSIEFSDGIYMEGKNAKYYTNFVSITYDNQSYESVLQGKENRRVTMLLAPGQQEQSNQSSTETSVTEPKSNVSWLSFLKLGMEHILTGYDHLLFLFILLIKRQSLKEYIALVTAFTVAHSITLSLAVLGIADLPSRFVEAMIALSICYVAIENIVKKHVSKRWLLTFLFGLIHGMGFANILKDMDISKEGLVTALVSFNVGIELVQVIIVILLLPLLVWYQKKNFYRNVMVAGSILTFIMGAYWLIERVMS